MTETLAVVVQLQTRASRADAWRVFSDSDAINRVLGLGYVFEEIAGPDGRVRRVGRANAFGIELRWEEVGLWFERPNHFLNRRVYEGGPVARVETEVTFADGPEGAVVRYENRITPRTPESAAMLAPYVEGALRPAITAMCAQAQLAAEIGVALEPPPPPLKDEREVQRLAESIVPAVVGLEIARLLAHAPLRDLANLRPLAVAARLGLDPDVVVAAFAQAAVLGLVALEFASLCPACHGAKRVSSQVGDADVAACPSCHLVYDAGAPERLEAVFRAAPPWRLVFAPVDCLLSPSRTPHVLARVAVAAREQRAIHAEVGPGLVLEVSPHLPSAILEARPGSTVRTVTFDVGRAGVRPAFAEVAPGPITVFVTGREPVEVTLKTRDLPPFTLTAGRLLQIPGIAALLPPGAVAVGARIKVEPGIAVVFVGPVGAGPKVAGARLVRATDQGLLTVWRRVEDALAAIEGWAGETGVAIGVASGAISAVQRDSSALPGGLAVDRAAALAKAGGNGHVWVDVGADPGLLHVLGARGTFGSILAGARPLDLPIAGERLRARVTAERAAADARVEPRRLGGCFRVVRAIARGGMGAVYEVFDEENDVTLVLKTLLPELAADPTAVQRFYNEARMSISLDHPNVVHVCDYGQDDDTHELFLVMEKLEGKELRDVLDARGALPPDEARGLGLGLLRGLGHAHDHGIVHRDLKPENIFVVGPLEDPDSVKLIDFGIAHPMDTECDLARQGIIAGTPMYLSPEQIEVVPLDGRSDLYAAGLVLWEAVAGEPPWRGKNPYEIVMARTKGTVPDLRVLRPRTPNALAQTVVIATRLDRDERFADAAAMARALG